MRTNPYATLLLLLGTSSAHAQITLTGFGDAPIGSSMPYAASTDSVDPGPGGAVQSWDFTDLPAMPPVLTISTLEPSSTAFGLEFPTADRAESNGSGTYIYYSTSAGATEVVGFVDSTNDLHITYPDPWRVAQRPFTFADAFTDDLSRAYINVGLNFGGTGLCSVEADGYGTLILPTGSVTEVLRVRLEQHCVDTSLIGNVNVDLVRTSWFVADLPYPVMTIERETIISDFFSNVRHLVLYADATALGIEQHPPMEDWNLTPAGEGLAQLRANASPAGAITLEWFSICGSLLSASEERLSDGSALIAVPMHLPALALLLVTDASGERHCLKWSTP